MSFMGTQKEKDGKRESEREREREADRQTDRQTDGQTERAGAVCAWGSSWIQGLGFGVRCVSLGAGLCRACWLGFNSVGALVQLVQFGG